MKCLYCDCTESKVIDSRSADDDRTIRRRRECTACGRRFTTYETIEVTPMLVVKNDGNREAFNVEKVRRGIVKACEKRPVSAAQIDEMVTDISKQCGYENPFYFSTLFHGKYGLSPSAYREKTSALMAVLT